MRRVGGGAGISMENPSGSTSVRVWMRLTGCRQEWPLWKEHSQQDPQGQDEGRREDWSRPSLGPFRDKEGQGVAVFVPTVCR